MEQILVLAALLGLCYILLRLDGLIPRGGGLIAMGILLAAMAGRWWLWAQTPSGAEDTVRDAILWFQGAGGTLGAAHLRRALLPAHAGGAGRLRPPGPGRAGYL